MTKEEFVVYFHWLHTMYKAGKKKSLAVVVFEAQLLPQSTEKTTKKFIADVEMRSVI